MPNNNSRKRTKAANNSLNKKAKFNIQDFQKAISESKYDDIKAMLEAGINPNLCFSSIYAPINIAALNGNIKVVSLLLQFGADINAIDFQLNPLYIAIQNDNIELLRFLLIAGAQPNVINSQYLTPVIYAIEKGNLEIVQTLIDFNACENPLGASAFSLAAFNNDTDIIKILSKHTDKFDINKKDRSGRTALHYAARYANLEAVVCLVKSKAVLRFRSDRTHSASTLNSKAIMSYDGLTIEKEDFDITDTSILKLENLQNIEEYDKFASKFYYNGLDINETKQREQKSDRLLINKILIEAELHEYFNIFEAITFNRIERIKELALQPENFQITNIEGETPLTFAILQNNLNIIELLLELGANADFNNSFGLRPLSIAVKLDKLEAVKLLLKYGANITQSYESEISPLNIAVSENKSLIVEELLKNQLFGNQDMDYLLLLSKYAEENNFTKTHELLEEEIMYIYLQLPEIEQDNILTR